MRLTVGSMLVYGSRGVCKVEDVKTERFGKDEREYYVLCPMNDQKSRIYVPVDSDRIEKQARRVITPDEIDRMLSTLPEGESAWIEDNRTRADHFRSVLEGGDLSQMMQAIHSLYLRKSELTAAGKHLNTADENIFVKLEKLLHNEFALALGISCEEVMPFIRERLTSASAG